MGLSTLRVTLLAMDVHKRQIMPNDWDTVWELIVMCIYFMILYFMASGSIHVENPRGILFRLGGELNSKVAQVLLSEQEHELPH